MPKKDEPNSERTAKSRRIPPRDGAGDDPSDLLPSRFTPPSSAGAHQSGAGRDPAGARLRRSGWTRLNVAATDDLLKAAGYPANFESMGVYLAADPGREEIAGRLVAGKYRNLSPLRYSRQNRTMVIYLHTIFKDFPQLRPSGEKWVTVVARTESGISFIVIQLGLALSRRRGPRTEA